MIALRLETLIAGLADSRPQRGDLFVVPNAIVGTVAIELAQRLALMRVEAERRHALRLGGQRRRARAIGPSRPA